MILLTVIYLIGLLVHFGASVGYVPLGFTIGLALLWPLADAVFAVQFFRRLIQRTCGH